MKTTFTRMRRAGAALAFLLAALAGAAPAGAASPVTLEIQAPEGLRLGEETRITAALREGAGAPVRGATVILWSPGSFLSTDGFVEQGRATTGADGKAVFAYQPRTEGSVTLNATFTGDSRYEAVSASVALPVTGSAQLYSEEAGIRVPGISVWLLVAVLSGVWGTYFMVMVLLGLIARAAPQPAAAGRGGRNG